ncbi:NAD(P)-dependent oxidoreductase [Albimonas pacifica]|uniref:D-3-phosphoglycerate dehydrogenase n=1 Tax=Albimonas pacifica TaxID=1114924 RepID=A0A1I3BLJ2_9RHOB|nr:NAD(P)-dependent oxidoreductase [Albimonas pacifica]SFH63132.1 D-3-phosphoglycerate dehydrogenase [Albimonas pacifica]
MSGLCLIRQPIHPAGLALLRAAGMRIAEEWRLTPEALAAAMAEAEAAILRDRGLPAAMLASMPRLRVAVVHGAGVDRIALPLARELGVAIAATPGENAISVAEQAFALLLALARRVPEGDRAVREGRWDWRDGPAGRELRGLRLGLVGWGEVARQVARIAGAGFGMQVAAFTRHGDPAELAAAGVAQAPDLDALLAASDVVSLHARPAGAPLIDARALALLPPGALLINTARGALVDEAALLAALDEGRLAGAGLDVCDPEPAEPDGPLVAHPGVLLSPHVGGMTEAARIRTAEAAARRALAILAGRPDGLIAGSAWPPRQVEAAG